MKKVIIRLLVVISLFLITGCNNKKKIEVVKKELQDGNKYNIYFEKDNRIIYLSSSLEEVYYNEDTRITLKDYISKSYQTMDDSIKHLTDLLNLDSTLRDGGTKIYRSKDYDFTMVVCNRIKVNDGTNKDIYMGDYNLSIDDTNMCSR